LTEDTATEIGCLRHLEILLTCCFMSSSQNVLSPTSFPGVLPNQTFYPQSPQVPMQSESSPPFASRQLLLWSSKTGPHSFSYLLLLDWCTLRNRTRSSLAISALPTADSPAVPSAVRISLTTTQQQPMCLNFIPVTHRHAFVFPQSLLAA